MSLDSAAFLSALTAGLTRADQPAAPPPTPSSPSMTPPDFNRWLSETAVAGDAYARAHDAAVAKAQEGALFAQGTPYYRPFNAAPPAPAPAPAPVGTALATARDWILGVAVTALIAYVLWQRIVVLPLPTPAPTPPPQPPVVVQPTPTPVTPAPQPSGYQGELIGVLVLPANPTPEQAALRPPNAPIEQAFRELGASYVVATEDQPEVSVPGWKTILAARGPPPVVIWMSSGSGSKVLDSTRPVTAETIVAGLKRIRGK